MKLIVNGDSVTVAGGSLAAILDELGYADKLVATAVNGDFVPLSRRERCEPVEGDAVEVIAPLQGG